MYGVYIYVQFRKISYEKLDLLNQRNENHRPGPEVIKLFSCSTQLSMKFFLLIIVKMPTVVGILTIMSRKNSILGLSEPEKKLNFLIYLNL